MKKGNKLLITLLTAGMLAGSVAGSAFAEEAKSGEWRHSKKGWWYSYTDGSYAQDQWLKLGDKWYLFDAAGYMVTGWKKLGGKWYYLNSSGAMATGWKKVGNKWYYLDTKTGAMVTGWLEQVDKLYYLMDDGAMATGTVEIDDGYATFDENGALIINDDEGINYFQLVNKTHKLPEDWESMVVLEEAVNRYGEKYLVEKNALANFLELQKELLEEGIIIELDSTTRSVAEQQKLWDDWIIEFGEDYVKKYVAVPGFSEHHTGLAIDVCIEKDGKRIDDNDEMIAEKEIFAKVHEKLAKYGFILRYLEGKEDITGYGYEPWHFRYINNPAIAKEIMDAGITLEEYLEKEGSEN